MAVIRPQKDPGDVTVVIVNTLYDKMRNILFVCVHFEFVINKLKFSITLMLSTKPCTSYNKFALKFCTSYYLYRKSRTSYNLYDSLVQVITCTIFLYML